MAPGKRKRPDRQASHDDGSGRPSPHRPENLGLAQQSQQNGGPRGGRGGRRQSRNNVPASPAGGANTVPVTPRGVASPAPARETPTVETSRPATPLPPPAASTKSAADEPVAAPPAPYCYEHVTDERVEAWQGDGRQAVQDAAKEADELTIGIVVQELARSALDSRLDASEAGGVIKQMIADREGSETIDVQATLLNTISLLDDTDTKNSKLLTLVTATEIDPDVIRQELDIPLLQTLALVRSTFTQMRTRKTTNILYRQANFNLLREESEGYAKLVTEYFSTANEAVLNHDVSAEAAFQRIKALVGSFDLDVGRVLDITLDISANLLVRAYGFFVKFYRCSSWWPEAGVLDNVRWEDQGFGSFPRWALPESERPWLDQEGEEERKKAEKEEQMAMRETRDVRFWQRVQEKGMDAFFDLGSRKIVDFEEVLPLLETEVAPELDARQKEINADRRKRINENRKFMKETGTLPPPGNSDAAQLLGFKLRFYASDARSAQDSLPENLIYLAALLIKIGFISLRDLYPHLHPSDDGMADEKSRLEKEKAEKEAKERPGGGMNALAMAGALPDDTLAPGTSGGSTPKADKKDDDTETLPTPSNQKIMLLKALLLIGALPEALYILGRFPWLLEVDTSLAPYLHRIARQMLSKVADATKPLADRPDTQQGKQDLESTIVRPDGTLLFRPKETKKVTRWLGLDQVEKGDGQMYRHYYPDWDENIPVCQNVEDVFLLCNTFLGLLGVKIGQDAALLSSLVRIAKHSLTEDASEHNRARWLELMKRLLVPSLSLSKHNVGLTQEVYELLKFYPTTTRYNVYAEWYLGRTSRLPDMRVAFDHNRAEVKDILRRVTNETGKKQARALAKVSLSSPGIVMMSMISQIEEYSNMIASLVECTRYFSLLAYDVLTWSLINSLSGQGKSRMQDDGMLTSRWLQYISQFVASLFLRYTFVNPSPILQYLVHQLSKGDSTDLEMFEQVLTEMGGIRSDIEYNDTQVFFMAGGENLQSQVLATLGDKRSERKPSAQRLIKALAGPGLIGQTLVAIAQEKQMYPYRESSAFMPLKVLGNNLDKIQSVFAQYLEVLKSNVKPEDFEASLPSVVELVSDYGLEPGTAFAICRFGITSRMSIHADKENEKKRLKQEKERSKSDATTQDATKPVMNGDHAEDPVTSETKPDLDADMEDSKTEATPQPSGAGDIEETRTVHPVLEPIINALSAASPGLAEQVSVQFFVEFWTHSLPDIPSPMDIYNGELAKLTEQLKTLRANRSDMSAVAVKDRQQKIKDIEKVQSKYHTDMKHRVVAYQKVVPRLSAEKKYWFSRSMEKADIDARHIGLLQQCFLPRAMVSSLDALYAFLMLRMLHDFGTPGFSTMHLLNQLFKKRQLTAVIFQCTAMEAQHLGRFLCEILKLLQKWHADPEAYDKEALAAEREKKLPGFAKKLGAKGEPDVLLDYEDFRRLLYNWHSHLGGALEACFKSGEYMHIRNGITVLKAVVPAFPSLNFQGLNMVKHITTISQEDSRQDLKLAAMSLLGPLKGREKKWILPQAFRLNDEKREAALAGSRAPSAKPATPQPEGPKLDASASEFKPTTSVTALANGAVRKESATGTEDGEIEDTVEKSADVTMKDAPAEQKSEQKATAEPVKAPEPPQKEPEKPSTKPSTPAPLPSKPPATPADSSRPDSTQPSSRAAHDLPARPDSRPPTKPLPPTPSDRGSGRYPSRNEDRYGRLDRPGDVRPASRDHSPGGRSRPRSPPRDPYYGPQAAGRGPRRDERPPSRPTEHEARHPRDDGRPPAWREPPSQAAHTSRSAYDTRERTQSSMGPPTSHSTHPDRAAHLNSTATSAPSPSATRASPAQAKDTQGPHQHNENPARLALINDDPGRGSDRSRDLRPNGHSTDGRIGPEARSNDGRSGPPESPRDAQLRSGSSATDLAPNGPRQGRGSRDLGAQSSQESSYGRLNGPHEVPAGPRPPPTNGPSGRGSRSFPVPHGPASSRSHEPPPQSPSSNRQSEVPAAPRGPGGRQHDRRSSQNHFEQQPASNSVPTTPAAESGPSVHPSRLARMGAEPPPVQTNTNPGGSRSAASPVTAPPSGPRGPGRAPAAPRQEPPSAMAGPPSGPASDHRRGDRQRANINATLQGSNNGPPPPPPPPSTPSQNINVRGAALNRTSSMSMASAVSTQPIQAVASSMEPPPRRNEPVQPPRSNGAASRPDSRQDNSRSRPDRYDERTLRQSEDPYADKRHSSRNNSPGRRAQEEQYQRLPSGMDGRDVRGSGRDDRRARDDREAREGQARDARGGPSDTRRPPEMPASFNPPPPPEWQRGSDRRSSRRDLPQDDGRIGGPGNSRPEDFRGPRREEYGRGPAPRDDGPPPSGNRKRRHEEAPPYEDSKRRRSGR
ncbi:THO2 plays a role in transcriptional elongation [Saxophila tyrrhenica]|uniref:THO complex subunit 2 n=1 Tax=Saxophila tyrrhenica TaxID=1690608 RepID=A0AAV9P5I4_9PEZI|nr:THO2 plays a role in transcriptional elongation [Saxophila tyrrhenica]